jgi:imidazolonepropionase-like amidohydrolase
METELMNPGKHRTSNIEHRTPNGSDSVALFDVQRSMFNVRCSLYPFLLLLSLLLPLQGARAETILLMNGVVHTVAGETFTNGSVLIDGKKISRVFSGPMTNTVAADKVVDLRGQHLYPGLIAVNTVLGLSEIDAVRATQDTTEVGDYTPDVESWVAVNPDSELLPVARANGIAYFEPVPGGGMVAGQSGLLAMDGWTYEQMIVKKPVALHVFWPGQALNTTPKESAPDPAKWKSLDDQAKERRAKLKSLADFFEEAKAYAKAKAAATAGNAAAPEKIPAWEAMLPYVRGELPIVIHADEVRQIRSAVNWAATNHYKVFIAGGRDAAMVAGLLATNKIPVIYEDTFVQPVRDTESYDVHFSTPEVLHRAGVTVVFSVGPYSFGAGMARNLPYNAAQAMAFGLPEGEALKGITLYAAQLMGVADRLGSIEAGKDATLFVADGDIFDIRANVKRLWIAGQEVSLENRHTRLYEKYKNRPK